MLDEAETALTIDDLYMLETAMNETADRPYQPRKCGDENRFDAVLGRLRADITRRESAVRSILEACEGENG